MDDIDEIMQSLAEIINDFHFKMTDFYLKEPFLHNNERFTLKINNIHKINERFYEIIHFGKIFNDIHKNNEQFLFKRTIFI